MKQFDKSHYLTPQEAHQVMVSFMIKIRKKISNGFFE